MSRRIKVYSEQITEIDLVEEVLEELNISSLSFNSERKCFESIQYDHIVDNSIQQAEKLYYSKRKARNIEKVNIALKKQGYQTTSIEENNTTKIKAVQRVYV